MSTTLDRRKGGTTTLCGVPLRRLTLVVLTFQFSAFILILHYSRIMPQPDGHRYLPSTAVFLVELMRLTVCLTVALYEISTTMPRSMSAFAMFSRLGGAVFGGDSWKMALPAGLYTLANSLQYVAISNLDAATFHVTYQFKIIVTAVLSVVMLKKAINAKQWLSLIMLMVGVAIVSVPPEDHQRLRSSHHSRVYMPRSLSPLKELFRSRTETTMKLHKRSATYEGIAEDEMALYSPMMDASIGLLAVLTVCLCSGFAGVYFEKTIKTTVQPVSMWIRNVQLSLYSLFPAFFIGVLFLDGETVAKHGFFAGYNWVVILSIVVQTFGAVVAAFCMYYADNISKNFAISISIVLSAALSVVFFDFHITLHFIVGTLIVVSATYIYTAQNSCSRPPTIMLYPEDEKPRLMPSAETDDVSIPILKTPLTADDAITTSRPGSPAHKKRKNEPSSYFPKLHD